MVQWLTRAATAQCGRHRSDEHSDRADGQRDLYEDLLVLVADDQPAYVPFVDQLLHFAQHGLAGELEPLGVRLLFVHLSRSIGDVHSAALRARVLNVP